MEAHNNLEKLTKFIESNYGNDIGGMGKEFMRMAYMLHYLEDGHFGKEEIREKAFLLYQIGECMLDEKSNKP